MGRAINASRSGILLEATRPIKAKYVTITTVDLENKQIKLNGLGVGGNGEQFATPLD
jgi:hypothetical protein